MTAAGRGFAVAVVVATALGPASAISGRVQDEAGRPIERARACVILGAEEVGMCVNTDPTGYFSLPGTEVAAVRVSAAGFLALDVAGIDHEKPIRLARAARFDLDVVDAADGSPVAGASVWLLSPDGRRQGPIRLGEAGKLAMNSFVPGEYRVEVSAEGYGRDASTPLVLAPGASPRIVIRLRRAGGARGDDGRP